MRNILGAGVGAGVGAVGWGGVGGVGGGCSAVRKQGRKKCEAVCYCERFWLSRQWRGKPTQLLSS